MAGAGLYEIKTYGGRLAAREAFQWLGFPPLCAFPVSCFLFFFRRRWACASRIVTTGPSSDGECVFASKASELTRSEGRSRLVSGSRANQKGRPTTPPRRRPPADWCSGPPLVFVEERTKVPDAFRRSGRRRTDDQKTEVYCSPLLRKKPVRPCVCG